MKKVCHYINSSISTTMRHYYYIVTKLAQRKDWLHQVSTRIWTNRHSPTLSLRGIYWHNHLRRRFLVKWKIYTPYDPVIPLLEMYRECVHRHICKNVHKTIFVITKSWKPPKCPLQLRINTFCYIHIIKYYSFLQWHGWISSHGCIHSEWNFHHCRLDGLTLHFLHGPPHFLEGFLQSLS